MDAHDQHLGLDAFASTDKQLVDFIQNNLTEDDWFQLALAPVVEVKLQIFSISVIPNQVDNLAHLFTTDAWVAVAIHPNFQWQMTKPVFHCLIIDKIAENGIKIKLIENMR